MGTVFFTVLAFGLASVYAGAEADKGCERKVEGTVCSASVVMIAAAALAFLLVPEGRGDLIADALKSAPFF